MIYFDSICIRSPSGIIVNTENLLKCIGNPNNNNFKFIILLNEIGVFIGSNFTIIAKVECFRMKRGSCEGTLVLGFKNPRQKLTGQSNSLRHGYSTGYTAYEYPDLWGKINFGLIKIEKDSFYLIDKNGIRQD